MRLSAPTQTRKPTEDIAACTRAVLLVLNNRQARGSANGVTSGWIEDRGIGFTEYAIGAALRKLAGARRVGKTTDGGHIFWFLPDEGEETVKPKKPKKDFGSL